MGNNIVEVYILFDKIESTNHSLSFFTIQEHAGMQLNWKAETLESLKENISSCNLVSQIPLQWNGTVFFLLSPAFFWVLKYQLLYKLKLVMQRNTELNRAQ